jgi:hypothetical protein
MKWYATEIEDGCPIYLDHGVAYVLPKLESHPRYVKRIGAFGVGLSVRLSSWSIGFDILKAGLLIQLGPAYIWIAHIEKQIHAFEERLNRDGEEPNKTSPVNK